ncbi:MAG: head GIN domain-containing protein [Termitinemataceae bacterium]
MKSAIKYAALLSVLIGAGAIFMGSLQNEKDRTSFLPALHLPSIPLPFQNSIALSGKVVEEVRPVSFFDSIKLPGSGKLTVHIGDTPSLTVRADKALLDRITTEQKGTTLILSQKDGIGFTIRSPIEYELTTPSLRELSITGSGNVVFANRLTGERLSIEVAGAGNIQGDLDLKELEISILGSGNLALTGSVNRLTHKVLGSGDLHGISLNGKSASITILGSGKTDIGTFEELNVTIAGSGDVIYSGTPRIQSRVPGSGKLRSR